MNASGHIEYEQVLIGNCSNGHRAETYVIRGEPGSGSIQMNGAMARLAQPGDWIIVLAFAFADTDEAATIKPRVVVLDEQNAIVDQWDGRAAWAAA